MTPAQTAATATRPPARGNLWGNLCLRGTLDRYIFRDMLRPGLLAMGIMLSLIWLMQSLRFLDFIINKGLGAGTFFQLTILLVPKLLMIILPLACFAGVVAGSRRLLEDNEFTVMLATGRSRLRVAMPALAFAVAMVAASYWVSLWALPRSTTAFKDLQYQLRTMDGQLLLAEGTFNQLGDLMVYLKERTGPTSMKGLLIQDQRTPAKPVTWLARDGLIQPGPDGTPQIVLNHGERQQIVETAVPGPNGAGHQVDILSFEQQILNVENAFDAEILSPRVRDESEYGVRELLAQAATMEPGKTRNQYQAEAVRRLTWPISSLPLAALAAAMMLRRPRRHEGTLRRIAPAVIVAFVYQGLMMMGVSLGEKYGAPALSVLCLLPAMLLAASVYMLSDRNPTR